MMQLQTVRTFLYDINCSCSLLAALGVQPPTRYALGSFDFDTQQVILIRQDANGIPKDYCVEASYLPARAAHLNAIVMEAWETIITCPYPSPLD